MKKRLLYSMLCVPLAGITMATVPFLTSCNKTEQPSTPVEQQSKLINLPIQEAKSMFGQNNVNEVSDSVEISGFDSKIAYETGTIIFPQKINNKPVVYNGVFKTNFNTFTREIETDKNKNKSIKKLYLGDEKAFEFICINQKDPNPKIGTNTNNDLGFTQTHFKMGLTDLVIGGNIKKIPSLAFQYCELLENVTISDDVCFIEQSAFRSCTNIKNIKFNTKSNVWIDSKAFLFTKSQGPVKPTETTAELPTRTIEFGNIETFLILGNNNNVIYKSIDPNSTSSKTFWTAWWLFDTTNNNIKIKCKESLKNEISEIATISGNDISKLTFI